MYSRVFGVNSFINTVDFFDSRSIVTLSLPVYNTNDKGEDTAKNSNLVYSTRMSRSSQQPAHQTTHGQTCCQVLSIKDFDTTPATALVAVQTLSGL